jgi:hypothetical protein
MTRKIEGIIPVMLMRAKYRLEAYATLQHHVADVGTRAHRQNAFDALLKGVDRPLRQVM